MTGLVPCGYGGHSRSRSCSPARRRRRTLHSPHQCPRSLSHSRSSSCSCSRTATPSVACPPSHALLQLIPRRSFSQPCPHFCFLILRCRCRPFSITFFLLPLQGYLPAVLFFPVALRFLLFHIPPPNNPP